jgi:hypothetical protein
MVSVICPIPIVTSLDERIEGFRKISGTGQKLCSNLKAGS